MDARSLVLLLLLAATWGSSYLFIAVALEDLTPAAITFLRLALGSAVVLVLAARAGVLRALRGRYRAVVALGAVQLGVPLLLIAVGERWIPSALAGTLVASTPVWGAVLAPVLGSERILRAQWGGILLGLVGVALLLGVDAGANGAAGYLGAVLVLLSALGYAVGAVAVGRWFSDVPRLAVLSGSMGSSALLLLPPSLVGLPTSMPSGRTIGSVLVLGLVGTGIAFVLFYRLIADIGPQRTVLVTYLAPVFAVTYGATLLDEPVGPSTLAGLLLVLVGAWLAGRRQPESTSRTQSTVTATSSSASAHDGSP